MNLPPGFTSRPATPDDLDDVVALLDAWQVGAIRRRGGEPAELQFEWGAPVARHRSATRG